MREFVIEEHFKRRVRETGGIERKVAWPARRGAPDRLAGWPGRPAHSGKDAPLLRGRHGLVELKKPGEKAEPHQLREHERLRSIGIRVDVIDTKEGVDRYVEEMSR